jgi:hypothetical protein
MLKELDCNTGLVNVNEIIDEINLKVNKDGDVMTGDLEISDSTLKVTDSSIFFSEFFSNRIEFITNDLSYRFQMKVDDGNGGIDFKINNDTSFSVLRALAPSTKYQPTEVNSLTRKDYVDTQIISGLNNKLDLSGGTLSGKLLIDTKESLEFSSSNAKMLFSSFGDSMPVDGRFYLAPRLNNDTNWDYSNALKFDYLNRKWSFNKLFIEDYEVLHEGNITNLPISDPVQDELNLKYNKTGGLITGNVIIGDGTNGESLIIRGASNETGNSIISFKNANNSNAGLLYHNVTEQTMVLRAYDSQGAYSETIFQDNGNISVTSSAPIKSNDLTRKDYVDTGVNTREPNLGLGSPGQFLAMSDDGLSKIWKQVDIQDGEFLPLDGRLPMTGNFTVGNGVAGNTITIRGSSYSDDEYLYFKRQNNSNSVSFIYSSYTNDLTITKYATDGITPRTSLTFTDSGNIAINGLYPLLSNHLANKGYVDNFFFKQRDFIDISSGINDAGKPIILNTHGQVDSSMIPLDSGWVNQGQWTPTASAEYPDITALPSGSYWSIVGVDDTTGYTFTTGELSGEIAYNGNLMIWAGDMWELRVTDLNPFEYYKLDGSLSLQADFAAGGFQLKNVADGTDNQDAATIKQLSTKQDDLLYGTNNQVLTTVIDEQSNAILEWQTLPQLEGAYLPLDGSGEMVGTLKVGDGTTGNRIEIRASSYSGYARQYFVKTNKNYGAQIFYSEGSDEFEIRKYAIGDNTPETQLILDNTGNVRLGTSVAPTHNEHLITKKWLEGSLDSKEDYLGVPSSDFQVLATNADGTRFWTPMITDDPSHIDPGESITGTIGSNVKNIFGIDTSGTHIMIGDSEAGNNTSVIARGSWDFQVTNLLVNSVDTIWHSGNDGDGSGLDADSVDGIQGSDLVQTTRLVDTTDGIQGGGSLDSNLTLSHSTGDGWEHLPSSGTANKVVKHNGTSAIWEDEIGGKIWVTTNTYNSGDLVTKQNGPKYDSYISITDNNTGNDPETSPVNWYNITGTTYLAGIFDPFTTSAPHMPDTTGQTLGATWYYYWDGTEETFTYPDPNDGFMEGITVRKYDTITFIGSDASNPVPEDWLYLPKATVSTELGGVPFQSGQTYEKGTLVYYEEAGVPKLWVSETTTSETPGTGTGWLSISDKKLNITGGILTGNLYIGDGTSGDSLYIRGASNGNANILLSRTDGTTSGSLIYDNNTDIIKIRRYESDGTNISTEFRLENDGNLSVYNLMDDVIPTPSKNENLTTKKYVDSGLSGKENSLGNPLENGMLLSSETDGTRNWVAAPKTIPELTPGDFITAENISGTKYDVFGVPDTGTELEIGSSNSAFPTTALGNWGFTGIVDIADLTVGTINGGTPWTSANPGLGDIGEVLGTVDDGSGNKELGWITAGGSSELPHFEPGDFMTANIEGVTRDIFGIGAANDTIYIGDTTAGTTTPVIARGSWDFQGEVNVVKSDYEGITGSADIINMVRITADDYAALGTYDPKTIYIIVSSVTTEEE